MKSTVVNDAADGVSADAAGATDVMETVRRTDAAIPAARRGLLVRT
jgi:hypothetical protein